MDEEEILDSFTNSQPRQYSREVPVGNVTVKRMDDVRDGFEGSTANSIDAFSEDVATKEVFIIEGKKELNKMALGQVLFYSYLFEIERDIVRQGHHGRRSKFEGYEYHVDKERRYTVDPDGKVERPGGYNTRPSIQETHRIIVGELTDDVLPLVCRSLGIDIYHRKKNEFQRFDYNRLDEIPKGSLSQDSLRRKSSQSLDSEKEEEVGREFVKALSNPNIPPSLNISSLDIYKEVPLCREEFGSQAPVCDLIIKAGGYWLVAEVKSATPENSASKFKKAFGQAVTYASLFSQIKDTPESRIVPVIVQEPVNLVAEGYRQEYYDGDLSRMFKDAAQNTARPFIYGSSETVSEEQ